MFTKGISKGTTKISRTGKLNPLNSHQPINSNKGNRSRVKHKTGSNHQLHSNNNDSHSREIHSVINNWTGHIKTVTRELKIITGRNSKEVVAGLAEVVGLEEAGVVAAGEGKIDLEIKED